jgi:rhomboid protease GluP
MAAHPLELMTARIATRSKRQAMEWSLVLVSQGIESTVDRTVETGWGLIVATPDYERALVVIHQYRVENLGWPWRQRVFRQDILFDWGSLAWVLLACLFFWISECRPDWRSAGLMDNAAVSRGEWWRLCTAVFLHADPGHLAANAGLGLVLLGLAMGRYGTGVGLLAAYLAGVSGNLATWLVLPEAQRSLGASGMVMACVGLLAAQSVSLLRRNRRGLKLVLTGLCAGVMLFLLMGLAPGTNVIAHLGGFVSGLLLGGILTLVPKLTRNAAVNILAGALFSVLVILPWWLAASHEAAPPRKSEMMFCPDIETLSHMQQSLDNPLWISKNRIVAAATPRRAGQISESPARSARRR